MSKIKISVQFMHSCMRIRKMFNSYANAWKFSHVFTLNMTRKEIWHYNRPGCTRNQKHVPVHDFYMCFMVLFRKHSLWFVVYVLNFCTPTLLIHATVWKINMLEVLRRRLTCKGFRHSTVPLSLSFCFYSIIQIGSF